VFYDVLRYTHIHTQEQGASGSGTSLNAGVHISAGRIYRTECFNKHNRVAICGIAVHKNNDLGGDDLTFPLAGCWIKRSCAGVMKCSYELFLKMREIGSAPVLPGYRCCRKKRKYVASLGGIHSWNYSLLSAPFPASHSSTRSLATAPSNPVYDGASHDCVSPR
jgi:hypothetical protein